MAAGPEFLGRTSERDALDRLLATIAGGQSAALVIRGEAGIGKTALLRHAAQRASGSRVAQVAGAEAEMELALAGLHQLCAPMLSRLDALPPPQQEALRIALGLAAGPVPDQLLVGLAVLGLLAAVAEERPLLCLVDDAQWLDAASATILGFVARRLQAESVAMVVALREPRPDFDGLPELVLGGLSEEDARTLLTSAVPGRLDDHVRDRIVAETRGNPLALLELPRIGAGGFELPAAADLPRSLEDHYVRRAAEMPDATRQLLLLAAAEPTGDAALVRRAADVFGIDRSALAPAAEAQLIEIGARVRFRHPLVRSATYRAATSPERQAAHGALAEATDPETDPDRRAWHRAHATVGVDEAVAAELERSAGRAQARGGAAAAAAFLARAAELTPDPAERGRRALAAAQAKFDAAGSDAAIELLAAAELAPLDELQRAQVERLRAEIAFARTRGGDAPAQLLDAARRLEPLDAALARETHLESMVAAMFAGRLGTGAGEAGRAARAAPAAPQPRAIDLLLDGLATASTDGFPAAVPQLRTALEAFRTAPDERWLWLACRLAQAVWDDELWHELSTRGLTVARESGALGALPIAATYRAALHVHEGEFDAAASLIAEADAITEATGSAPLKYATLMLAAWRGDTTGARAQADAGRLEATARGEGMALGVTDWAIALLYNGHGRYADALVAARQGAEHDDVGVYAWSLVELIEAGARSGANEASAEALDRLTERTRASGTDWALGVEAGSRALLSEDPEPHHREAIERLEHTRCAVQLARARLLYGEWLRREHRRVDAREQLRAAHERFGAMGAEAFAERARIELLATGETVRKRRDDTRDELTPQERQIARLAGDGLSNPEIGARLFLSPRTVEWHLRKVFQKLDIRSRLELETRVPTGAIGAP